MYANRAGRGRNGGKKTGKWTEEERAKIKLNWPECDGSYEKLSDSFNRTKNSAPCEVARYMEEKVKNGDSIESIAEYFGMSPANIEECQGILRRVQEERDAKTAEEKKRMDDSIVRGLIDKIDAQEIIRGMANAVRGGVPAVLQKADDGLLTAYPMPIDNSLVNAPEYPLDSEQRIILAFRDILRNELGIFRRELLAEIGLTLGGVGRESAGTRDDIGIDATLTPSDFLHGV